MSSYMRSLKRETKRTLKFVYSIQYLYHTELSQSLSSSLSTTAPVKPTSTFTNLFGITVFFSPAIAFSNYRSFNCSFAISSYVRSIRTFVIQFFRGVDVDSLHLFRETTEHSGAVSKWYMLTLVCNHNSPHGDVLLPKLLTQCTEC
jgi:hypothetical protein